jgi:putative NIF3 family GTP cyclohydrolase 1 type 2
MHTEHQHNILLQQEWGRRRFLQNLSAAAGATALGMIPGISLAVPAALTIQEVIDRILKEIPGTPFRQTVDTIKAGDPSQAVTGIVTTMFATVDVIEKAAALGANFIIAHEPAFYNHADDTKWLEKDSVYQYKMALLKKHNMVVWRFHDYIHAHQPDGVMRGVQEALGWVKYADAEKRWLMTVPATPLHAVIVHLKNRLGIEHLRYIGDAAQVCSRIVFIPGSAGGRMQINAASLEKPDLLIVGEVDEWETSEYVRDLRAAGGAMALVVLGHIVSEEPGMEWMLPWLQEKIKGIAITHLPSRDAFSWA